MSANASNPGNRNVRALANSCFYVNIGQMQLVFSELSGLKIDTEITEYQEGGENTYTHRLPGRTKYGNLVLKRGIGPTQEFMRWYGQIIAGRIKRQNITVKMYDLAGSNIATWEFANAYPVAWSGPNFAAHDSTLAIETLELAHEGLNP